MKKNGAFRRAAALMAALSITVSLAAPAFAGTYYIDDGDITIIKNDDGSQTIQQQGKADQRDEEGEETIITTREQTISTLESDLEGPAAEDSGFGPVVEDNYQPAQPESTEEPEGADQPEGTDQPEDAEEPKAADRKESTEEPKSAGQQPQQAALTAAPAAPTSVNPKENGFWGNTITVINNFANKALKLTLKDVKIDVSGTGNYTGSLETSVQGKAALSVQGSGNVEIELDGDNELKSGFNRTGLEKISTGTLTLKDDNQKAGSLTATGGCYGAGIGGGYYGRGENITITDSTVTATGKEGGAGIGGGVGGSGENITITGSTVTAISNGRGQRGYEGGAGIGGGRNRNGSHITITGSTVTAEGGYGGAGIGGGAKGSGSNVTVSGAAQVTTTAGKSDGFYGAGATISNGGNKTPGGELVDGEEIQADISDLITGYIHHIIYNRDGSLKREWWEPERPQPNPEDPNAPAEESNEVDLGTPWLHVETLEGDLLPFDARQQGTTLRVTTDNLSARLHGTRQALEALREQGVEQIQFVTTLKTTTLPVAELLAEGGSWFALEHDGLGSRRLSAAQAESLKCRMH